MEVFSINESIGLRIGNLLSIIISSYGIILLIISIWYFIMKNVTFSDWMNYEIFKTLISNFCFYLFKIICVMYSLFWYIFISNYLGLIPSSKVITSEVLNNLILALAIWLLCLIIGINLYKLLLYKHFIPSSIPLLIIPLMAIIELISFTSRLISLTIRLTANMIGSLIMLKLIGSLSYLLLNVYILPIISLMTIIYILEISICAIQAYVFCLLSSYILHLLFLPHIILILSNSLSTSIKYHINMLIRTIPEL